MVQNGRRNIVDRPDHIGGADFDGFFRHTEEVSKQVPS